jgi:hypothetical protein
MDVDSRTEQTPADQHPHDPLVINSITRPVADEYRPTE